MFKTKFKIQPPFPGLPENWDPL